jgi:tetratricopeptide (TPR) repeat protein
MKTLIRTFAFLATAIIASSVSAFAQGPAAQQDQPEFIKQGQQLMRDGKFDDALALYRKTLESSPNSLQANIAAGSVLDLMGKNEEARKYFQHAIDTADTPEHKAQAQRAMAISYAFEGDCSKTLEYEAKVIEYFAGIKNFNQQGEIYDEGARVCLDSSDDLRNRYPADRIGDAASWYSSGHETGLQEPDIKPSRVDLWNFRWEHAQARIAARRGKQDEAQKHVAAANAILDIGTLPEQAVFLFYLKGYVAFYAGDYKSSVDEFLQANQNDPFIQLMLARSYEKLGDKDKALDFYRKAAAAISHNPTAAYAVPYAKKKLASKSS